MYKLPPVRRLGRPCRHPRTAPTVVCSWQPLSQIKTSKVLIYIDISISRLTVLMKKPIYAEDGVRKSCASLVLVCIGVFVNLQLGPRLWLEIQTVLSCSLFQIRYTDSELILRKAHYERPLVIFLA
jgi:hypothetical protein